MASCAATSASRPSTVTTNTRPRKPRRRARFPPTYAFTEPERPSRIRGYGIREVFEDPFVWAVGYLDKVVASLGAAAAMIDTSYSADHDLALELVRLAGVRLGAAILGLRGVQAFSAYVQLADWSYRFAVLHSSENTIRTVWFARDKVDALFAKLEGFHEDEIAQAAASLPPTIEELSTRLDRWIGEVEDSIELLPKVMLVQAIIDLATLGVSLRGSFGMRPPAAPMTLPVPMFMGVQAGNVATMGKIVLTAEQVEALRRLVQIGALSAATVTSAVRAGSGVSMASKLGDEIPPGLEDLLGKSPETSAMHVTGKAGAGMERPPRHHVMPKEHRKWFEDRGMSGDLDIDNFTVTLSKAEHQALHGGGNWRLGRTWPGEWNQHIMRTLTKMEAQLGRRLKPNEILKIIGEEMKVYGVPMRFVPYKAAWWL